MRNYVDPNLNNFTENCHKKLMKILKHWKAKFSILVLGFKFKMFFYDFSNNYGLCAECVLCRRCLEFV